MKISDRRLRLSDSLKISDFSNSLVVLQHPQSPPKGPQQYAYNIAEVFCGPQICHKCVGGRGSVLDPAGGTYDDPTDPIVGWEGDTSSHSRLLGAFGASI